MTEEEQDFFTAVADAFVDGFRSGIPPENLMMWLGFALANAVDSLSTDLSARRHFASVAIRAANKHWDADPWGVELTNRGVVQ